MIFTDLGLIKYKDALQIQTTEFEKIISAKNNNIKLDNNLIFCEHPNVLHLGKCAFNNLLVNSIDYKQKKAEFFKIKRGGDITFHGPGQLVGYPILI